jgi:hypothetical protein
MDFTQLSILYVMLILFNVAVMVLLGFNAFNFAAIAYILGVWTAAFIDRDKGAYL